MFKRSPVTERMARSSRSALLLLVLLAASVGSFRSLYGYHPHAECNKEADGQYVCLCHVGYQYTGHQRDGYSCLDIDECANDSTLCENGACVNKDGEFECDCDDGLVKSRDGKSCLSAYPVDEVEVVMGFDSMSLEWPQVSGHVEYYSVSWWPLGGHNSSHSTQSGPRPKLRNGRYNFFDLKSGCGYEISVAAQFANHTKDLFTIESRTYPIITSEMTVTYDDCSDYDECEPTLIVKFTQTSRSATQFDKYRFRLEGDKLARTQSRPAEAPGESVKFSGLVPGRLYNISMWIVSGNVTSFPVERQQRLRPASITQLNFAEIGSHHVSLTWDKPVGDYTFFQLAYFICRTENNNTVKDIKDPNDWHQHLASSGDSVDVQVLESEELGITMSQLQPHTLYLLCLTVCSGDGDRTQALTSNTHSKMVTTLEALPPAPYDFRVLAAQPRALKFSWQLDPVKVGGVLRRFQLECAPTDNPEAKTTLQFPHNARGGVVTNLVPGEYLCSVCAKTGAGAGPAARLRTRVDLEAPRVLRHSSTTVTVSFRVGYSTPKGGGGVSYSLVVAKQPHNDTPADLLWHDVRALEAWQLYRLNSSSVEEFTIGSEPCAADSRGCSEPLKPDTAYYIKLRVYNTPDNFTDSTYTVFQTDTTITSNTIMIISAICATALILLVIIIIATKKQCWSKYNQPGATVLPTCTQRNPFYLNLLFREDCAREIAEIEQWHYDGIQESIYAEIGNATR